MNMTQPIYLFSPGCYTLGANCKKPCLPVFFTAALSFPLKFPPFLSSPKDLHIKIFLYFPSMKAVLTIVLQYHWYL